MKQDTTYFELNEWEKEIHGYKQMFPRVSKLMASRFGEFEKRNAVYLNLLHEKRHAIFEANVEKTEDGKYFDRVKEEGKPDKWKFFSPDHETAFTEGWKELMEKHCSIIS